MFLILSRVSSSSSNDAADKEKNDEYDSEERDEHDACIEGDIRGGGGVSTECHP